MDKTLRLSEWEALFTYKHLVRTRPYLKVLVDRGDDKFAKTELGRLDRYRLRLRKYLHVVHGYAYTYLDSKEI